MASMLAWLRRAVSSTETTSSSSPEATSSDAGGNDGPEAAALPNPTPEQSLPRRHNVLFAGLRRSGKTSILKRVYENLKSHETLYLTSDSTSRSQWMVKPVDGFVPLRLWDGPDPYTTPPSRTTATGESTRVGFDEHEAPPGIAATWNDQQLAWEDVGAVVYVIDSQDSYNQSFVRCMDVILTSFAYNPFIKYHIFVHKLDQGPGRETSFGLEDKRDAVRSMEDNVMQDLSDAALDFSFAPGVEEKWRAHQAAEKARAQRAKQARDKPDVSPLANNSSPGNSNEYFGASPHARTGSDVAGSMGSGVDARAPSVSHTNWSGSDSEALLPLEQIVNIEFHGTSIYDSSVVLALSKVQQSLMEPYLLHGLESALGGISSSCRFDGAYLIDVASKLYLASNLPPTETPYEMITEYLWFLTGLASIYADLQEPNIQTQLKYDPDAPRPKLKRAQHHTHPSVSAQSGTSARSQGASPASSSPVIPSPGPASGTYDRTAASSTHLQVHTPRPKLGPGQASVQSAREEPANQTPRSKKSRRTLREGSYPAGSSQATPTVGLTSGSSEQAGVQPEISTPELNTGQVQQGKYAYSTMWMADDMGLAFYQIDNQFALVAIVRKEAHDRAAGLIEYNLSWFRRTITDLTMVVQTQQLKLDDP